MEFRTFRNSDPPAILDVWQASRDSRAFGVVSSCDVLENLLFSKPYFDPEGLILAEHAGKVVGFAHAGFGADESKSRLDYSAGAVYMLRVRPECRRRGVGESLLRLAQAYLARRGAQVQYFGGMFPLNAFYLGLYGGSELPGVLDSDAGTKQFALSRGYEPVDSCLVYHCNLAELPRTPDSRIHLLRRSVEVQVEGLQPMPATWWDNCIMGNIPSLRYEMFERDAKKPIGRAWVWLMECFSQAWDVASVGITDFHIEPEFRRRGYGKLLLLTMLKHLREQNLELVELQTMSRNEAARGLYEGLGFQRVDAGRAFRLAAPVDTASLPKLTSPPLRR
jgi:ribosomal protein S18 acetylase RimI-like enzyme